MSSPAEPHRKVLDCSALLTCPHMAPCMAVVARRLLDCPAASQRIASIPPAEAALIYGAALLQKGCSRSMSGPESVCRAILEEKGLQGATRRALQNKNATTAVAPAFMAFPLRRADRTAYLSRQEKGLQLQILSLVQRNYNHHHIAQTKY